MDGNTGKSGNRSHKAATKGGAEEDDEGSLPNWADQICSLSKSHIAKHFPDKETTTVSCIACPSCCASKGSAAGGVGDRHGGF